MNRHEQSEDQMLIVKAKKGDTSAYENLVRKYQKKIYFLCLRMTGAHQSADDLSQETFMKAYFSLPKFKEEMNFFTWIRKIAVNSTLNYLKIWKREKPMSQNMDSVTTNPGSTAPEQPQQHLERTRLENKFTEALSTLPPDQRAVFILKVFEDQSYKNIAQIMNIAEGTVMSRLNRARHKLKLLMSDYLEGASR